ncbi:MAG: hypothetical protein QGG14_07760 [Planctomycetota bacterium]|jgi:hypothetical protein|nr:hypothetical protein [Planctomycetota bacterium]
MARVVLSKNHGPADMDHEEVFDLLMNARKSDWVQLALADGQKLEGAIIFNEFKGTGRLINIDKEISVDFRADQVQDVKF